MTIITIYFVLTGMNFVRKCNRLSWLRLMLMCRRILLARILRSQQHLAILPLMDCPILLLRLILLIMTCQRQVLSLPRWMAQRMPSLTGLFLRPTSCILVAVVYADSESHHDHSPTLVIECVWWLCPAQLAQVVRVRFRLDPLRPRHGRMTAMT